MNTPQVRFNLLAKNTANARQIWEATHGQVLIGVMVKNYPSLQAAARAVEEFQQAGLAVSVGLGAGDPAQWDKVVQVSVLTRPDHVNQVFPAAGYTLAALQQAGSRHTLVNALIAPSGTPGKVIISTGPRSQDFRETVSCDAAAAMLQEIGVQSVKFYPVEGAARLDEVAAMVKAAVRQGMKIFEPTGGIDLASLPQVVAVCAENGAELIIPHVYSSIVDGKTGLTRLSDVEALVRALPV